MKKITKKTDNTMPKYACSINYALFASALITAKILGKRSFDFFGNKYKVADYIKRIAKDIEYGFYKVVCEREPFDKKPKLFH